MQFYILHHTFQYIERKYIFQYVKSRSLTYNFNIFIYMK